MQNKILRVALIGVGNMGKKYAQMIVSGEVANMKLTAVVIRRDELMEWGEALVNVDGEHVRIFRSADDMFKAEDVDQKAAKQAISDLGVNATIDEVCTVGDTGYVITTTDKDGYGGDIQVSVGIQSDGTVTGVSFLSLSETAGLGMKAKEPSFYEQYVGKNPTKFAVSKDGGDGEQIDALSGATITSRAVTGAVNAALGYYQNAFGQGGN